MEVIALQSGSNGNCYYLRAGQQQLMFDAGISGQMAQRRLAAHGRDIREVEALFISHDHRDHAQSMGIFNRKFGHSVFVSQKTYAAARRYCRLGEMHDVHHFVAGETITLGDVRIHTIPTPHDGVDGVVFVVEHDDKRVGILSDLGHVFAGLRDVLLSLDAVVIESNYDPQMLEGGFYPERLKQRIRGRKGHLSNEEAAGLLLDASFFNRLKWACLCHLSEENNDPSVALETHRRLLGPGLPLHIARRDSATDILVV